jgi:hypothetical protein
MAEIEFIASFSSPVDFLNSNVSVSIPKFNPFPSFYKSKMLNCCSFNDFTFLSVILSFSAITPHNIGDSGLYLPQFFTTLSPL